VTDQKSRAAVKLESTVISALGARRLAARNYLSWPLVKCALEQGFPMSLALQCCEGFCSIVEDPLPNQGVNGVSHEQSARFDR
jgi:hypothetical protein